MSMTNYLENALVNHIFRESEFTQPTTLAVALLTDDPGETTTGQFSLSGDYEVADSNGYARQAINPSTSNWSNPASGTQGETDNVNVITFPTATGSWGTITHVAIVSTTTHDGGQCLFVGELDSSKAVGEGDTFSIAAGALNIQFAKGVSMSSIFGSLKSHFNKDADDSMTSVCDTRMCYDRIQKTRKFDLAKSS